MIESERLTFVCTHQKELRVDDYGHFCDSINDDATQDIDKLFVLPSTITGGPRYIIRTQDAVTYIRLYSGPDLFLTFNAIQSGRDHTDLPQDR